MASITLPKNTLLASAMNPHESSGVPDPVGQAGCDADRNNQPLLRCQGKVHFGASVVAVGFVGVSVRLHSCVINRRIRHVLRHDRKCRFTEVFAELNTYIHTHYVPATCCQRSDRHCNKNDRKPKPEEARQLTLPPTLSRLRYPPAAALMGFPLRFSRLPLPLGCKSHVCIRCDCHSNNSWWASASSRERYRHLPFVLIPSPPSFLLHSCPAECGTYVSYTPSLQPSTVRFNTTLVFWRKTKQHSDDFLWQFGGSKWGKPLSVEATLK